MYTEHITMNIQKRVVCVCLRLGMSTGREYPNRKTIVNWVGCVGIIDNNNIIIAWMHAENN